MDKPELFQIGTVAKLFHLSVSSLRHYEDIGLLKPEYGYQGYLLYVPLFVSTAAGIGRAALRASSRSRQSAVRDR